jgi:methylaspartate ammonia-lyase
MTSIRQVLAVPAVGAGHYEDLAAVRAAHIPVPERFNAAPVTPGFQAVREVAEALSVGLVLNTGQVAWGDCVAVAYSGKAGRAPVFRAEQGLETIRRAVVPALEGRELEGFRELSQEIDGLVEPVEVIRPRPLEPEPERGGGVSRRALLTAPVRFIQTVQENDSGPTERVMVQRRLHPALRYGLSQALLQAVALERGSSMAEVICEEWSLPRSESAVPIHAQSGGERYVNAEKMILRRVASLPHALVDDIPVQLGQDGSEMTRYIRWLAKRIEWLGGEHYRPTIHLDLHGALGEICGEDLGLMLGQLYGWESAAQPYPLRIESPMDLDSRAAQIRAMQTLREYVRFRGMEVQLVADEWANSLDDIRAFVKAGAADMIQIKMPDLGSIHNSVDAVLACKAGEVGVLLGGSYAETDLSARVSVHVALATQPDIIMAKPGMGVDEAISLVENEMARTLALNQSVWQPPHDRAS